MAKGLFDSLITGAFKAAKTISKNAVKRRKLAEKERIKNGRNSEKMRLKSEKELIKAQKQAEKLKLKIERENERLRKIADKKASVNNISEINPKLKQQTKS